MTIRNLTPKEWANGLLSIDSPEKVAAFVANENLVPWSRTLLSYIEDNENVLDSGSGTGQHSAFLSRHGRRMTLIDFSRDNLKFSSKVFKILGSVGHFVLSDMKAHALPFGDNSFDAVFSVGVLEYFTDEEINRVLLEFLRVSNKKIILMVPNAFSIAYRIGRSYSKATRRWAWGSERPFNSLRAYFRTSENVRITEFTVGTRQALDFLPFFGGMTKQAFAILLRIGNNPTPSRFRQGFILVTLVEKHPLIEEE